MSINRDNYELLFLMYVDNELSAAERNAVELFAAEHSDLQEEFKSLQAAALTNEEITFIPKTLLYRSESQAHTIETSLLLYLDNELDAILVKQLEENIASEPGIKTEWEMLKKTRLDAAETLIFEDKASLYRHERDKVIVMNWWRIAAAAILIAGGIFTGISIYNRQPAESTGIARQDKTKGQKNSNVTLPLVQTVTKPVEENNVTDATSANNKKELLASRQPGNIDVAAGNTEKSLPKKVTNSFTASSEKINMAESNKTYLLPVQQKRKEITEAPELIAGIAEELKVKTITRPMLDEEVSNGRESFAKLAVNNEGSNDQILYMDEERLTRSKVGSLFRKVKRVVERNTHIKTSDGLRIGGFELAIK